MSSVKKSIDVQRPLTDVYNQWTRFEDFPAFMDGVEEVQQLDDRRLRWQVHIGGVERSFEAEIIEQEPDERISWRTEDGEDHTGAVTFHAIDDATTRVDVVMSYRPEGWVEKTGDALNIIDRRVESDLQRFKDLIEDDSLPIGGWRGRIETRNVKATDPASTVTPDARRM